MIANNIQLTWVLDRAVSQPAQKAPLTFVANFRKMVARQWQQLAIGAWHFRFSRYGQLCAAAHVCQLGKAHLAQALKEGPDLLTGMDCAISAADQPRQLVLMDFWCEPGQGKAFIEHLRDQLKPQHESIVYFRIKNGKRIAKMLTRNDATTFMRRSQAARVDEGIPFLQTAAARDFYLPTYNTQMAFAQRVGEMALLKVMLGLLQPVEGEVLYGGVPVRQLGMANVRRKVGTVMQEDVLLTGSIADNIAFFEMAPDQQRIEACGQLAQLHQDIVRMPMGYQTLVGELGSGLSGGQKQRLLLARALYKQPSILALDEATSHLDIGNEQAVNAVLAQMPVTRIVIAHRPETIASAQRKLAMTPEGLVDMPQLQIQEPNTTSGRTT